MTGSRRFIGAGLVAALVAGFALAKFQSHVLQLALRAGPPAPGEIVPRQLPYRGYLEQDGTPVTGSRPMEFRLMFEDAGVAWASGQVAVPVLNGHFETLFGDALGNAIPPEAFLQPYLSLRVTVNGSVLGDQRILSQAYAHRSATSASAAFAEVSATTPLIITSDMTVTVNPAGGAQFTTLQAAWAWVRTRVVRAKLTIQLADGPYDLSALPLGLELEHPDGINISLVGNTANASAVVLNSPRGIRLGQARLARLDGVRIAGSQPNTVGVNVFYGASLLMGPHIVIDGFDYPIQVEGHSMLWFSGGTVIGTGNGICVNAATGSYIQADDVTASNCAAAFYAGTNAALYCSRCSVPGMASQAFGSSGSSMVVATDLGPVNATTTFGAEYGAILRAYIPPTATYSFSPPANTVGNGNALIAR